MTPTLSHLYALRAHLDAVILALESETGQAPAAVAACAVCGSTEDQWAITDTLDGTRRRRCQRCGNEWEVLAGVLS